MLRLGKGREAWGHEREEQGNSQGMKAGELEGKKLWDLLVNYNPLDQKKEQETQRLRETLVVGRW